jgi:hypothetical protein
LPFLEELNPKITNFDVEETRFCFLSGCTRALDFFWITVSVSSLEERDGHGQNDNAAAVSVVSRELEKVLTEQKNCQGLNTDRASCYEIRISLLNIL